MWRIVWMLVLCLLLASCGGSAATTSPQATSPSSNVVQSTTTPSGARVTLSPASGPPGTVVTVSGNHPGFICWDGCAGGLAGDTLLGNTSASADRFTAIFTVPSIPWVEHDGIHNPSPGDYPVEVQCVDPEGTPGKTCGQVPAEAPAVFHLTAGPAKTCDPKQCAQITLTPSKAQIGAKVEVSGWAPLAELPSRSAGYLNVALRRDAAVPQTGGLSSGSIEQAPDGTLNGSFQIPANAPSLGEITPGHYDVLPQGLRTAPGQLGSAPLEVAASPPWSSITASPPMRIEPSATLSQQIPVFGFSDPAHIAYCTPDGIRVTRDGGAHWTTLPTAGAAQAAAGTNFPLILPQGGQQPLCRELMIDPRQPDTYYSAFEATSKQQGAPPVYLVAYETTDTGKSWQPIPPPKVQPGINLTTQFAGFQLIGEAVQSLFLTPSSPQPGTPAASPGFVAEQTVDGGHTWQPSYLDCPVAGPCVRWGPTTSTIGGMGVAWPQYVVSSQDGGKTWSELNPQLTVDLHPFGASQLVAISGDTVALLSGQSDYPVRVSRDGGQSWQVVSLPPLPGVTSSVSTFPGLTELPNGSLLARPDAANAAWQLLRPGADNWCAVSGAALPSTVVPFQAVGDRLWWIDYSGSNGPTYQTQPKSVPLSSVRCGR